jgi:outer membrane protein assembly factor BamB
MRVALLTAVVACLAASITAVSDNYVYPTPFQAWEQVSVANGTAISTPLTADGWIVVANNDGSLVGRQIEDFNGSSVWNYTAPSSPYSALFNMPNGQGFITYYGTYVLAMSYNGTYLWQWNTTDNNATVSAFYELKMWTPTMEGDLLYIGTASTSDLESPSYVYALNMTNGVVAWASFAGGNCNTQMDKDQKKLYVASYQNGDMLQAFDLKTGELVWNVTLPHMALTLKVVGEKLFVGSYTGSVWVHDASTGKSLGSVPNQGSTVLLPMTVVGETLFVFSGSHVNGVNLKTQHIAFLPSEMTGTLSGYMVDGETIFLAYYGAIYKLNAKTGKGGKFYTSNFIFEHFGGFTYLRNKTILAFGMSALVFLDAQTGKLITADVNTSPIGAPLLLPPSALGDEVIAIGNSLAAPGWAMECVKVFYVPSLSNRAVDGSLVPTSYWGTETRFTPMNPFLVDGTLYSFDTNFMYSLDPTSGAMNWEWFNANVVMITSPGIVYSAGVLIATTGYNDVYINASQGVMATYNASLIGAFGGNQLAASSNGLVYIQSGDTYPTVAAVNVNTFTVSATWTDSSIACTTAPTPLSIIGDGNWFFVQCSGKLTLLDAVSGLTVWNISLPASDAFTATPIFSADETRTFIGSSTGPTSSVGTLYALNTSTGAIIWKLDTIDPVYTGNVSCTLNAATGVESCDSLIVATPSAMYSVNAINGAVQWKATHLVNLTGTVLASPIHIVGNTIVVRNTDLMWGVDLKAGYVMWTQVPGNDDWSYGINGASVGGRYFFTPMAIYIVGYDVTNGNEVLKAYIQGTPEGIVINSNCVMMFSQSPGDIGDNEIMGLTLPESLCTPLGSA